MSQANPRRLTTPEDDFIKELRSLFPSLKEGEFFDNRIRSLLKSFKGRVLPIGMLPPTNGETAVLRSVGDGKIYSTDLRFHAKRVYPLDELIYIVSDYFSFDIANLNDPRRGEAGRNMKRWLIFFAYTCCKATYEDISLALHIKSHSTTIKYFRDFIQFVNHNIENQHHFRTLRNKLIGD